MEDIVTLLNCLTEMGFEVDTLTLEDWIQVKQDLVESVRSVGGTFEDK